MQTDHHPTDEEIARRVQTGETAMFAILVERYEEKLLRYARRFLFDADDSQDMVQTVFIKAYEHIQSFDNKKRFSPWIYRIAHNEFLNAIKKKTKYPTIPFDFDILLPHLAAKQTTDGDLDREETKQLLDRCLEKIDVKYREPLVLHYFQELDYKEIADVLHIPISTVGVRLRRGKEKMKKLITRLEQSYDHDA